MNLLKKLSNIEKLAVVTFFQNLYLYSHVGALYQQSRGLSLLQINSIWSIIVFTIFLAEVPTGVIADKIGRKKNYNVNVRVIAATNKNIEVLMKERQFREDLYYRLNILNIQLSPLRERKDDVVKLLKNFMEKSCNEFHVYLPEVTDDGLKYLSNFQWPGNVRQLKNVVQRLVLMGTNSIGVDEVEAALGIKNPGAFGGYTLPIYSKEEVPYLKEAEIEFRKRFVQFVRKNSRTDAEAANKLGIARSNFHRLCKELGLK